MMDFFQNYKRIVLIVVISLIIIFVSKALLSKAVKSLSIEAQKKQQIKSTQPVATLPASAVAPDNAMEQASSVAVTTQAESAPAITENMPAAH